MLIKCINAKQTDELKKDNDADDVIDIDTHVGQ